MDAVARLVLWRLQRAVRGTGWAAIGGVALALFAAIFFVSSVMPLQDEVTGLRARVKRLQAKQVLQPEPAHAVDKLGAFYEALPLAQQAADVVRRLHTLARDAGLVLDHGEYRPVTDPSSKLVRYQIVLPVKGNYLQVRQFLAQAMRDTPGLALDGIGFQRQAGESGLEAQLRLTVYLRAGA